MKTSMMRVVAMVGIALSVMFGCAHQSELRAGDEAMESNDAKAAVEYYRQAQQQRPGSQRIADRIDEAEEALLGEVLEDVEEASSQGRYHDALAVVARKQPLIEDSDRRRVLRQRSRDVVFDGVQNSRDQGNYAAALWMLEVHLGSFRAPQPELERLESNVRTQWHDDYRRRAVEHERGGRDGAAALYFAQADEIVGEREFSLQTVEALERVLDVDGWVIELRGEPKGEQLDRVADGLFETLQLRGIGDGRRTLERGQEVVVSLEVLSSEFDSWTEQERRTGTYIDGYEEIPNPEYEQLRDELRQIQGDVATARHRVRRAQRDVDSARRQLRRRHRQGQMIRGAERRLDRAYRTVERRQRQLERLRYRERRVQQRLRFVDSTVERPVERQHVWEATRQIAEMTAEVEVQLDSVDLALRCSDRFEISRRAESIRHEAQPELGLEEVDEPPPGRAQLEGLVDDAIGAKLAELVEDSFDRYRHRHVAELDEMSTNDEIDALSRFFLLNPGDRRVLQEDRLEELVDIDRPVGLLIRLCRRSDNRC